MLTEVRTKIRTILPLLGEIIYDFVRAEELNEIFFHCPLKTATESISIHISSCFKKANSYVLNLNYFSVSD